MPGAPTGRVALVTGGNRGVGLEVCRQLAERGDRVVLGARDKLSGEAAARSLPGHVEAVALDVTDAVGVAACVESLVGRHGGIDVLVNNAGVHPERLLGAPGIENVPLESLAATFGTHVLGPAWLIQQVLPGMKSRGYGRIVNVSSGLGRFFELDRRWPFYRTSKAALNALTRIVADDCRGFDILVNAVCPGWVRTRMGGDDALRDVPGAARGIVWAAELPAGGPTGGLFRDGENFGW